MMKFVILIGLLYFGYCSGKADKYNSEESQIAVGGFAAQPVYPGNVRKNDDDFDYLGYDGLGGCIGQPSWHESSVDGNATYDYVSTAACDKLFGYTGPTVNDERQNLERPCSLEDWECIRKFFAANSKCKPAYGPLPDPLVMDVNTIVFSGADMEMTAPNVMAFGLSTARIREFYLNKKTGNVVFAVDVTNWNETIPRAYFRYWRKAKESIVLAGFASIQYSSMTFTAVIPMIPDLRFDLADMYANVHDSTPALTIAPSAFDSLDPEVLASYLAFISNLPMVAAEDGIFRAQIYTSVLIQSNICDFGLKLSYIQ